MAACQRRFYWMLVWQSHNMNTNSSWGFVYLHLLRLKTYGTNDINQAYKLIHRYSTDNYIRKDYTTAAVPSVSTSSMRHDHQITVLDKKMCWMCKQLDNFPTFHVPLAFPCRSLSPAASKVNFTYLRNMSALHFQVHSLLFCKVYWYQCLLLTNKILLMQLHLMGGPRTICIPHF